MSESPDIARIAALIGDPAPALTASEPGETAGVGKATASSHLAQLAAGGADRTRRGAAQIPRPCLLKWRACEA